MHNAQILQEMRRAAREIEAGADAGAVHARLDESIQSWNAAPNLRDKLSARARPACHAGLGNVADEMEKVVGQTFNFI